MRETPALPDGFLERFEAKLAEEATPPKVFVSRGAFTASPRRSWTRGLMAALIILAALAGLVWTRPGDHLSNSNLLVVMAGQDTTLNGIPGTLASLATVSQLSQGDTVETGSDGSVVLMAGSPGNEIKIAPDSKVALRNSTSVVGEVAVKSEFELSAGTVFVTEQTSRISVRTSHALFQPVGTDYTVTRSSEATTVSVLEGAVNAVPYSGGAPIRIGPGEQLVVGPEARWDKLRPTRLSAKELEPLVQERQSFGKLKDKPALGEKLPPYPKARAKPTEPAAAPNATPRQPNPGLLTHTPTNPRRRVHEFRVPGPQRDNRRRTQRPAASPVQDRPNAVVRRPENVTRPRISAAPNYPRARLQRATNGTAQQDNQASGYRSPSQVHAPLRNPATASQPNGGASARPRRGSQRALPRTTPEQNPRNPRAPRDAQAQSPARRGAEMESRSALREKRSQNVNDRPRRVPVSGTVRRRR